MFCALAPTPHSTSSMSGDVASHPTVLPIYIKKRPFTYFSQCARVPLGWPSATFSSRCSLSAAVCTVIASAHVADTSIAEIASA